MDILKKLSFLRPSTPRLTRIPLPDTGEGDGNEIVTTKALKSPISRCLTTTEQSYASEGESSTAGRVSSDRGEMLAITYGEPSRSRTNSPRPRHDSPSTSTGGGSSRTRPLPHSGKLVPMKMPPVNLHWQLLPYSHKRSKPRLQFDIAFPIDYIRYTSYYPPRQLTPDELNKPAADEALREMVIRCQQFPDWHVYVSRPKGLRCRDVFKAIYETYNKVLTHAEVQRIDRSHLAACKAALKSRCKAAGSLPAYEEAQGLRRVDLLRGNTIFQGLTLTSTTPGSDWEMLLSRPGNS